MLRGINQQYQAGTLNNEMAELLEEEDRIERVQQILEAAVAAEPGLSFRTSLNAPRVWQSPSPPIINTPTRETGADERTRRALAVASHTYQ
jgi:hypothetical protein